MNENENLLLNEFKKIARMKWVKGLNNNNNSIGLTFEQLIGKKVDHDFFPDYKGIEIKCRHWYSTNNVVLFAVGFDGPDFFEINHIIEKYGLPDFKYPNKKVIYTKLNNATKTYFGGYEFSVEILDKENKLILVVKDKENKIVERRSYIDLSKLRSRFYIKFSSLAIIYAYKKIIDGNKYFRYNEIDFYKIRNFEIFKQMIINKDINIRLIAKIAKKGYKEGKYCNQNLIFELDPENLNKLFKPVYKLNYDDLERNKVR
jgi:hypothetical protein